MTDNLHVAPLAGEPFDMPLLQRQGGNDPSLAFQLGDEEALSQRFMRPVKMRTDLVYEFTRDPGLISQYCRLYDEESGASIPQFQGIQGEYNKKGHIIIAKQGNLCIGGARLSVSTPRQPCLLSMEASGFLLSDHFPELKQKEMRYGQLSRLVLLPDFRDGDVARVMFHHLYRKAIALNLDKVFVMAPLVNVRSYRKSALAYGLKNVNLYKDIKVPSCPGFEEVREYLLCMDIDKLLFKHDQRFMGSYGHAIGTEPAVAV